MDAAYLLLKIDAQTLKVISAGVYSEETPTTTGAYFYTRLLKTIDRDYALARAGAIEAYRRHYPHLAVRRPIAGHESPRFLRGVRA